MDDAIAALEAALNELGQARAELPDDLAAELDAVEERMRGLLGSLRAKAAETEG